MEFNFDVEKLLKPNKSGIALLNADSEKLFNKVNLQNLNTILDNIGSCSAKVLLNIYQLRHKT